MCLLLRMNILHNPEWHPAYLAGRIFRPQVLKLFANCSGFSEIERANSIGSPSRFTCLRPRRCTMADSSGYVCLGSPR